MRTERAAKRERTVVRSMTRVEGDDWTSILAIWSCGRDLKTLEIFRINGDL